VVGGVVGFAALLTSGCGTADGSGDRPAWDEIDDYTFTLEYFGGDCEAKSEGAWRITVEGGEATAAEPLNAAARQSSWAEGPPTLVELHDNALGVRADGAYDTVDIDHVNDGWGRRPAGVHYVDLDDGGYEGCETYTDFRPAD
jgi:hypothetical protein